MSNPPSPAAGRRADGLGVRDQEALVDAIVDRVLHPEHPRSCNLIVPPGFGDHGLARRIRNRLEERAGPVGVPVAYVPIDGLRDVLEYVRGMHEGWGRTVQLRDLDQAPRDEWALNRLVSWLPAGRPGVQVLPRFHVLVEILGQHMLGRLRELEQDGSILTVTITPLPYLHLKRRQQSRSGEILTVSDYPSPSHVEFVASPRPAPEAVAHAIGRGITPRVAGHLAELTGGYPDPFDALLAWWEDQRRPDLRPEVRKRLLDEAIRHLGRFVEWLDFGLEACRELIVRIDRGIEVSEAAWTLSKHPWAELLLDGERLRSAAPGAAVRESLLADAIAAGRERPHREATLAHAERLYWDRDYAAAARLLGGVPLGNDLRSEFLRRNAELMAALFPGDVATALEADWRAVARLAGDCCRRLHEVGAAVHEPELLAERYERLAQVAKAIVQVGERTRVVDVLAGLSGPDRAKPRIAAFLLVSHREALDAVATPWLAWQVGLSLPEQCARVWALSALGLNYYRAPDYDEALHQAASSVWAGRSPRLPSSRPSPGISSGPFRSSSVTAWRGSGSGGRRDRRGGRPVRAGSGFVRHPERPCSRPDAHADSAREQLLDLIDRWLACLLPHSPDSCTRGELAGTSNRCR